MKRIIIATLSILLFFTDSINAQLLGGKLILRAGYSADMFKGDNSRGLEMLSGYSVSADFNKEFFKGAFWNTGLTFGTRGYQKSNDKTELRVHALTIPVALGYKKMITNKCGMEARVGGFFSVDLAGKLTNENGDSFHLNDIDGYKRCDGGALFGIGLWFSKINIDYTYKHGFASIWEKGPSGSVNHMIRLGFVL